MNNINFFKIFFYIFFPLSLLFGESKGNKVIRSDLDSLNTLIKKSPERAIRYARELLDRIVPGEDLKMSIKLIIL